MTESKRPSTRADKAFEPTIDTNRFRLRRLGSFVDHVARCYPAATRIRVLDVGGSKAYWQGARPVWQHLPLEITVVNLDAPAEDDAPYALRAGDATALPEWADGSFDVVHSNSVIEHVGRWAEMAAMAREVRRLAPHYFVQTPNYHFPIEPHFRALYFHRLSEQRRARMLTRRRYGFRGPFEDLDGAMRCVQSVNLLDRGQMEQLFPDAAIRFEKVWGFNKSIIAIR